MLDLSDLSVEFGLFWQSKHDFSLDGMLTTGQIIVGGRVGFCDVSASFNVSTLETTANWSTDGLSSKVLGSGFSSIPSSTFSWVEVASLSSVVILESPNYVVVLVRLA